MQRSAIKSLEDLSLPPKFHGEASLSSSSIGRDSNLSEVEIEEKVKETMEQVNISLSSPRKVEERGEWLGERRGTETKRDTYRFVLSCLLSTMTDRLVVFSVEK